MGHLGLIPQSVHQLGGFRPAARMEGEATALLEDARALENAGVFAIVLERVPPEVAQRVTAELAVPTIGIGAGADCDGQVLVSYDAFGIYDEFVPPFVKQYLRIGDMIIDAAKEFIDDVQLGRFPTPEHALSRIRAKSSLK